jgi:hypothetical protein
LRGLIEGRDFDQPTQIQAAVTRGVGLSMRPRFEDSFSIKWHLDEKRHFLDAFASFQKPMLRSGFEYGGAEADVERNGAVRKRAELRK